MDVVLASKNPKKVAELAGILADVAPDVHLVDADWPDVAETGTTFEANALLKAEAVFAATGIVAVADDSGIEVDALGGAPGVYSARFAGPDATDAENLDLLLERMRDAQDRRARYVCVVAVVGPGIRDAVEGVVEGKLRRRPAGSGGFGYDPIFEPRGWDRTFAEVSDSEKAAVSHRGRAMRKAAEILAKAQADGHPRAD